MESADHVVDLVRVSDILQGTSCPIPNFHQLGLFKKDSMDIEDVEIAITHKKPPVRGILGPPGERVSETERPREQEQEAELELSPLKMDGHSLGDHGSKSEQDRNEGSISDSQKPTNENLPRTVSELRQVLRESTFPKNAIPTKSAAATDSSTTKQTKKKKTTKAPVPPEAAHKFVQMMLKQEQVKDIALAVPPNQDNSKKRKRGVSAVREDVAADIFNEDRLNHIHGWVELKTGEKKSFFVSHYQPIMLDVDVKDGGQYDELAFWIELRPSTKGGISSIHGEKVDWFVVENVPRPKSMSTEESVTKFFVCDRNKLCEFLYSKLPEKGTTTNNPFESVYTMYREGRKLQLKTRMPFKDLLNEELVELRV